MSPTRPPGGFGATIPIDVVGEMNVYQSPFLVEYGRFTAGVVDVETKRGGDKWHGELNDPTPELRIRSWHLVGIRAFTPRLSGSGPLIKNKLYVSGAFEYRLNKVPVFTQPFPDNESKTELWNSFAQFDYVASASAPAHADRARRPAEDQLRQHRFLRSRSPRRRAGTPGSIAAPPPTASASTAARSRAWFR